MTDNEKVQAVYDAQKAHNHELLDAYKAAQHQKAVQQMIVPTPKYQETIQVAGTGAFSTQQTGTGGFAINRDWSSEHGPVVAFITTSHGKGYWSDIRIHKDNFIRYKLHQGRWSKLLWVLCIRESKEGLRGTADWAHVKGQFYKDAKLEASLGKTFLQIDDLITKLQEEEVHIKFIKDIAATDPENLKMIGGLKKLDEGMTKPLDEPEQNGCAASSGQTSTHTNMLKKTLAANKMIAPNKTAMLTGITVPDSDDEAKALTIEEIQKGWV